METITNIFGEVRRRWQIDAFVVSFNETEHYFISEEHLPYIAQIRGIYFFNRNERTHVCEMTPSYWLMHVSDEVHLTEAGEALSDDDKAKIYEAYEHEGGDDMYIHCHIVDSMIKMRGKKRRGKVYHYGKTGASYSEVSYDDQIDSIREYIQGNSVL